MTWLEKLAQTIVQVRETYDTQVSRDIALLTELIEKLEIKQCQPEWELMQVSVAGPGLALPIVPVGRHGLLTQTSALPQPGGEVRGPKGGTWSW